MIHVCDSHERVSTQCFYWQLIIHTLSTYHRAKSWPLRMKAHIQINHIIYRSVHGEPHLFGGNFIQCKELTPLKVPDLWQTQNLEAAICKASNLRPTMPSFLHTACILNSKHIHKYTAACFFLRYLCYCCFRKCKCHFLLSFVCS